MIEDTIMGNTLFWCTRRPDTPDKPEVRGTATRTTRSPHGSKFHDQWKLGLGADANHLWTAFGPTNVAIHRVSTAVELGDLQVAVDLGPRVDVSALPVERRIRHRIEVARAYSAWNRRDEALTILLDAERDAPEQIRHHFISRQLVLSWIRQQRGKPSHHLAGLAKRLHVA